MLITYLAKITRVRVLLKGIAQYTVNVGAENTTHFFYKIVLVLNAHKLYLAGDTYTYVSEITSVIEVPIFCWCLIRNSFLKSRW